LGSLTLPNSQLPDPAVLAGIVAMLAIAAIAASLAPAARATRVDPIVVLKLEGRQT
jgi:ABC-type antimicrobial peptide transport system permease subunit